MIQNPYGWKVDLPTWHNPDWTEACKSNDVFPIYHVMTTGHEDHLTWPIEGQDTLGFVMRRGALLSKAELLRRAIRNREARRSRRLNPLIGFLSEAAGEDDFVYLSFLPKAEFGSVGLAFNAFDILQDPQVQVAMIDLYQVHRDVLYSFGRRHGLKKLKGEIIVPQRLKTALADDIQKAIAAHPPIPFPMEGRYMQLPLIMPGHELLPIIKWVQRQLCSYYQSFVTGELDWMPGWKRHVDRLSKLRRTRRTRRRRSFQPYSPPAGYPDYHFAVRSRHRHKSRPRYPLEHAVYQADYLHDTLAALSQVEIMVPTKLSVTRALALFTGLYRI